MIELISSEERKMIEYYRNHYLEDYDARLCDINYLLRIWENNKKDLFRAFGNKLMVKCATPVITLTTDQIADDIINKGFISKHCKFFDELYARVGYDIYYNICNIDIIAKQKIDSDLFFNINDTTFFFQKGTKFTTIWKKINNLLKIYTKEEFEQFTQEFSTFFTAKKTQGELVFSIHPLDYMTMSDNGGHWGSCMSWEEYGEYRQGTVEMMNSPYVVVAYLASKENTLDIGNYNWNSKTWRQLFIVSPYILTSVRSYPYDNPELTKFALDKLKEITSRFYFYSEPLLETDNAANGKYEVEDCTISFFTDFMYNDLDKNLRGRKAFAFSNIEAIKKEQRSYIDINYSGEAECMCCGETISYSGEDDAEKLVCDECSNCYVCEDCGNRIYNNDYEEINGAILCLDCASEYEWSNISHKYIRYDDSVKVRFAIRQEDGTVMMSDFWCFADTEDDVEDWADREVFHHWNGMPYIIVTEEDESLIQEICAWKTYSDIKDLCFLRV